MREVLVVRREDEFSRTLIAKGFSVINCPVIDTQPLEDLTGLENAVSQLNTFDCIFITSATAAEIFVQRARKSLNQYCGRIFVLGRRSFDILKGTTADIVFDETANTASGMLDAIAVEQLQGKRFLFIRGERSMRTVPERLNGIAEVEEAIVYRTVNIPVPDHQKKQIREKASQGSIAVTCFFSPSGVESFVEQIGFGTLNHTRLAAIGETTADVLRSLRLNVDVVAKRADSQNFAAAIVAYLKPAARGV